MPVDGMFIFIFAMPIASDDALPLGGVLMPGMFFICAREVAALSRTQTKANAPRTRIRIRGVENIFSLDRTAVIFLPRAKRGRWRAYKRPRDGGGTALQR